MLKRLFGLAGIQDSNVIVLGETANEITSFDSFVVGFVEAHPEDHFLLIVDENLEVDMDGMNQNCVSGSVLV